MRGGSRSCRHRPGVLYIVNFPTRESLLNACTKNWTETIQAAATKAAPGGQALLQHLVRAMLWDLKI